jgi:hypothetical protein
VPERPGDDDNRRSIRETATADNRRALSDDGDTTADDGPNRPPEFREPKPSRLAAPGRDELDLDELRATTPPLFPDRESPPNTLGVCTDCERYYEPDSYEFCPRCGDELLSVAEGSE